MSTQHAMYYFVNKDLKMKGGKIAAQCSHGMQYVCENISIQSLYTRQVYAAWRDTGCAKIILYATETQMEELYNSFPSEKVIDAGHTQVAPNSFTVLALYPRKRDDTFSEFKLVL